MVTLETTINERIAVWAASANSSSAMVDGMLRFIPAIALTSMNEVAIQVEGDIDDENAELLVRAMPEASLAKKLGRGPGCRLTSHSTSQANQGALSSPCGRRAPTSPMKDEPP